VRGGEVDSRGFHLMTSRFMLAGYAKWSWVFVGREFPTRLRNILQCATPITPIANAPLGQHHRLKKMMILFKLVAVAAW
jgi:hypothetical protein